jgi:ATP-dependent DNA ligase
MLKFVRSHGLEGIVAKRTDSTYQPGLRTGLWSKHRVNLGQQFIIGGYIPGPHGFDSLVIGFYSGRDLRYAARVRAGFVPATRRQIFAQIRHLTREKCPFRQSAREAGRTMGSRIHRREDERMRLVST